MVVLYLASHFFLKCRRRKPDGAVTPERMGVVQRRCGEEEVH